MSPRRTSYDDSISAYMIGGGGEEDLHHLVETYRARVSPLLETLLPEKTFLTSLCIDKIFSPPIHSKATTTATTFILGCVYSGFRGSGNEIHHVIGSTASSIEALNIAVHVNLHQTNALHGSHPPSTLTRESIVGCLSRQVNYERRVLDLLFVKADYNYS